MLLIEVKQKEKEKKKRKGRIHSKKHSSACEWLNIVPRYQPIPINP
jgi:hypothetical protein